MYYINICNQSLFIDLFLWIHLITKMYLQSLASYIYGCWTHIYMCISHVETHIHKAAKYLSSLLCTVPDEAKQINSLPFYFRSHTVNCHFCILLTATYFAVLCFLLVTLLAKMVPCIMVKYCVGLCALHRKSMCHIS